MTMFNRWQVRVHVVFVYSLVVVPLLKLKCYALLLSHLKEIGYLEMSNALF